MLYPKKMRPYYSEVNCVFARTRARTRVAQKRDSLLKCRHEICHKKVQFFKLEGPNCTSNQETVWRVVVVGSNHICTKMSCFSVSTE